MTCQRQIILNELGQVKSHPTADEVYQRVRRRLPRISLATVYRNLEVLFQAGLIGKLELGGQQRRFDGRAEQHYHARCRKCGRVEDLAVAPLGDLESRFRKHSSFEITAHRLELLGLCPHCRKKGS